MRLIAGGPDELARALERLMSLAQGDRGLIEVVACGARAIPSLRAMLFRREPSGLYQPRCRVVEALARLGVNDVLLEFISIDREISDPVERAGEDAVLNAAARALRDVRDEFLFRRLLTLADTRRLAGAVEALGAFRRPETLPFLIAALEDDLARPEAENAIRQFGHEAMGALLEGARNFAPQGDSNSESVQRRRRAALSLLLEICDPVDIPPQQRVEWINDTDPAIALLGCRFVLASGDATAKAAVIRTLINTLPSAQWRLRHDIDDCLIEYCDDARPIVQALAPPAPPSEEDHSPEAEAQRHLLWVQHHLRQ